MRVSFDIKSIADYRRFVRVRQLPVYRIEGRVAVVPDEYAARVDVMGAIQNEPLAVTHASFVASRQGGEFDADRDSSGVFDRARRFHRRDGEGHIFADF